MGAQRLLFALFVLLSVSLVVSADASKCHDAVILNLGVSPEEAKSLCAACTSVLPCNQCLSCFQDAKTLLAAAQCSINAKVTDSAHVMRRLLDAADNTADPSPAVDQSPIEVDFVDEVAVEGGGPGVAEPDLITILIG